ncbi:hypothetical protein JTB14_012587 [Gonioctena quinquepunctata]|nr:hypothetical protein JTB14_012587 [Gonioctena quinquepunctata]
MVNAPVEKDSKKVSKKKNKELTKLELETIKKEAALRYADTSRHIFNQSRLKSPSPEKPDTKGNPTETDNEKTPLLPLENSKVPKSIDDSPKTNGIESKSKETKNNDDVDSSSSCNVYEKIKRPDSRQLVQVEKVEVTYEPIKSQVEVVLVRRLCMILTQCIVLTNNSTK